MATGRELGFRNTDSVGLSLKEVMARATLRDVHSKGHPYIEIREDGKRLIFFCTLCLSPCYSDSALFDHLKGNIHSQRYAAAQVTLFGPTPWPFSDGALFFHNSPEKEQQQELLCLESTKSAHLNSDRQIGLTGSLNGEHLNEDADSSNSEHRFVHNAHDNHLLVPEVLLNNEMSVLDANFIGFGQIGLRIDEVDNRISRIWCAWLGESNSDYVDSVSVPSSDFAVIIFSYKYELGRLPLVDGLDPLVPPGHSLEYNTIAANGRKWQKSFSDPEELCKALGDGSGSVGGICPSLSNSADKAIMLHNGGTNNAIVAEASSDKLVHSKFMSSKALRKELRKQQRLAAERMCDICQQRMLPGKNVATLFNRRTGKLVCSSRNTYGVFHVFHVSCLIHWILLSEYEIWTEQSTNSTIPEENTFGKSKRKKRAKSSKKQKIDERAANKTDIVSVICPECQGTGVDIGEEDVLEKPVIPLSKMYLYKVKANEAHQAWMRSPEILKNCCIGLHFPHCSGENRQEKVLTQKLLQFYQVTE